MRYLWKAAAAVVLTVSVSGAALAAEYSGDPAHTGWRQLFSELFGSADVTVFILLTLLAVLAGMIADLCSHLRTGKLIPENLLIEVQEEMANGEYEKALELCEKSDCLAGQIFAAALSKTDYSFERMEEAMRSETRIQGLAWRQWIRHFRLAAVSGILLGGAGALCNLLRFVSDLAGRPNIGLALASSFEMRSILYNALVCCIIGLVMAFASSAAYFLCSSKLEKILLEAERLGEELLDPFRPIPLPAEE